MRSADTKRQDSSCCHPRCVNKMDGTLPCFQMSTWTSASSLSTRKSRQDGPSWSADPGGTTANKRKARKMIVIIEDSGFWHALARYKPYLTQEWPSESNLFLVQAQDPSWTSRKSCKCGTGSILSSGPDIAYIWITFHSLHRSQSQRPCQYPWMYGYSWQHWEAVG